MELLSTFDRRCYWLLLIVTVNVPGFTPFDPTGRSHDLGLFNPQSLSHIALTLLVAVAAFFFFLSKRSVTAVPLVVKRLRLLVILYVLFFCASLPWAMKDVALSVYRLSEWGLAFALVIGLYGSSPERTDILTSRLIFRIAAIIIIIVAAVAVVSPTLAFESINADTGFLQYRFGGAVYPPNTVGALAGVAVYYAFLFHRGVRRLAEVAFFAAAMVLTYSRGALLAFLLSVFLLGIMFSKPLARLLYLATALIATIVALIYQDKIVALLSRGRSSGSLTAASGRLAIWASGWQMFLARPLLGWGFIAGVKRHIADFYSNTTFAPQHLHNEFLQGAASGGFLAALLLVAIFCSLLVQAARHARATMEQQFLLFVVLQVFAHALEGPIFSAEFLPLGGCALLCLTSLALVDRYGPPRAPLEPLRIEREIDAYSTLTTNRISAHHASA